MIRSQVMKNHFEQLLEQRKLFLIYASTKDVWQRPIKEKWSIAETVYHLLLLLKRFRQLNMTYLILAKPIATLRKSRPYQTTSVNIYEDYQQKHKQAMKAPPLIKPSSNLQNLISYNEILNQLDAETNKLIKMVSIIEEDIAGHIHYPDPPARYPNLIQSIHLLAIHEQHHFNLCKAYEEANN